MNCQSLNLNQEVFYKILTVKQRNTQLKDHLVLKYIYIHWVGEDFKLFWLHYVFCTDMEPPWYFVQPNPKEEKHHRWQWPWHWDREWYRNQKEEMCQEEAPEEPPASGPVLPTLRTRAGNQLRMGNLLPIRKIDNLIPLYLEFCFSLLGMGSVSLSILLMSKIQMGYLIPFDIEFYNYCSMWGIWALFLSTYPFIWEKRYSHFCIQHLNFSN